MTNPRIVFGGFEMDAANLVTAINVTAPAYGAKPSADIDNTVAIMAAAADMKPGSILFIPNGIYNITNLVLTPPDDCTIICQGTLQAVGTGVALTIGESGSIRKRLKVEGLRVVSKTRDWSAGRVGVQLINLQDSLVDLRNVYGFEKNVDCVGSGNEGFVYNNIMMGLNYDGQKLVTMRTETAGWCNENTVMGGHYTWTSDVSDFTGCVALTEAYDAVKPINNNRYYCPSFESASPTAAAASIEGSYTTIVTPRLEGVGNITLEAHSTYCMVTPGRGVYEDSVVDLGSHNKVWTRNRLQLHGGSADANSGILELLNESSANYPTLLSRRTGDGVITAYILGSGFGYFYNAVFANGGFQGGSVNNPRKLLWGNGNPNGVVSAEQGSLYLNTAGGAGQTIWIKETGGAGNTGWVAK